MSGTGHAARPVTRRQALHLLGGSAAAVLASRWCEAAPDLAAWESLISFRPPQSVQLEIKKRNSVKNWHIHAIENAYEKSPLNLDYFPVTVSKLPSIGGTELTAPELLTRLRTNLNSFVDTRVAEFRPYDRDPDEKRWLSSDPLGTVIHIDMKNRIGNLDDGSVVVGETSENHWIFSTIWTVGDLGHPVSGNRFFGYTPEAGGGYTFFTRGADRPTAFLDYRLRDTIFEKADELWKSLQANVVKFVNRNGGMAVALDPTSNRYEWEPVRAAHHKPTVPWI